MSGRDEHLGRGASLALFDGEDCWLLASGRPPTPRDGADAVAELAVLAAASGCPRVGLLIPGRMRDVRAGEVVAAPMVLTKAERLPDGRIELGVSVLPDDTSTGTPVALEPARSPVASLLCEALSTQVDVPLADAATVLEGWGHVVVTDRELPPRGPGGAGSARYRVHRLAQEWSRRHRPMALGGQDRRPGVQANLPVGFVPACPL